MLEACQFAVTKAMDFYDMYASQGRWTRCVHCMEEARVASAARGDTQIPSGCPFAQRRHEPVSTENSLCKRCSEHGTEWKDTLSLGCHGCSACKRVLPASLWPGVAMRRHQLGEDLVCPACLERGYAIGRYESYKCNGCLEHLGHLRFDARRLQKAVHENHSDLICEKCRTSTFQCCNCRQHLGGEFWTKNEMTNSVGKGTKLICNTCRAKGIRAFSLEQYTCHACRNVFGAGKFPKRVLKRLKKGVQLHLVCLQCLDTVCPQCVEHVAHWDHSLTPNTHGCSACKRVFHHEHWSGRACTKRGYTSGRYGSYRCQQCLEELRSARFERHLLQDAKRQKGATLICEECRWKTQCARCGARFDDTYWTRRKRHSNTNKSTKLVCDVCRSEGFHAMDLHEYTCTTCAGVFGRKKFKVLELRNFKQHRRGFLECLACNAAKEERIHQLRPRMQQSRRRCQCHCRIHQPRCPSTPIYFGEKRLPGSDGMITAADRIFLDQLVSAPMWWPAAWGR